MKKSLALLYNVEYNNTVDREKGQQENNKKTTKKKGFKTNENFILFKRECR